MYKVRGGHPTALHGVIDAHLGDLVVTAQDGSSCRWPIHAPGMSCLRTCLQSTALLECSLETGQPIKFEYISSIGHLLMVTLGTANVDPHWVWNVRFFTQRLELTTRMVRAGSPLK